MIKDIQWIQKFAANVEVLYAVHVNLVLALFVIRDVAQIVLKNVIFVKKMYAANVLEKNLDAVYSVENFVVLIALVMMDSQIIVRDVMMKMKPPFIEDVVFSTNISSEHSG